jgi:hypothetical protein
LRAPGTLSSAGDETHVIKPAAMRVSSWCEFCDAAMAQAAVTAWNDAPM